jgi:hypothetical protein
MTDQPRRRAAWRDDTVVPLLMGALAVTIAGPAALGAVKQWAQPHWGAVQLGVTGWWTRNSWLVGFWALEILALAVYLWWFKRRGSRRRVQVKFVTATLARVLPADWDSDRHFKVLRWQGSRPVRLRVLLTPRSPLADYTWRRSVETALNHAVGPTEPIPWPAQASGGTDWRKRKLPPKLRRSKLQRRVSGVVPPSGSALAWDLRRPRLDVRVLTGPPRVTERRPDPWSASSLPRSPVPPTSDRNLTTADQRPYD